MGLFRSMDLGWYAGAHSSRALCGGTRAGGTGGKPDHGNHRQPECQGRAKRGAALDPQGFDSGKKISGRKRHILVDTLGLLLSVAVHAANIRDGAGMTLVLARRTRRLFPFIERIYGDGGYQGPKAARAAAKTGCWTIENRWTPPHRRRIRSLAQALDRRTHVCLAQPFPAPGT